MNVRYSCWPLPALRAVSVAILMCWPVAQAFMRVGLALFSFITKWKSCIETLPAPPPPPDEAGTGVGLAPAPGLDVDLVLVLGIGALALDAVELDEVVDRCHRVSSGTRSVDRT